MITNQDVHVLIYDLFDFYKTNLIQHINQIVIANQQACIKLRKDLWNILLIKHTLQRGLVTYSFVWPLPRFLHIV